MNAPRLGDGQKWYVAFTQPNGEMRAVRHLLNQDFLVYLPRYSKRRRLGRRISQIIAPLFPRYVFVGLDVNHQRWRSVNGTVGVSRLICQGDTPLPIDTGVVSAIAEQAGDDGLIQLAARPSFKAGQSVRITDGIFADQLGLYEGVGDQERVRILLELLGRKVRVMIEADVVAAA